MRVLITGAAGFIGSKLAKALLARGHLGGRTIERLRLVDVVPAAGFEDPRVEVLTGDITRSGTAFTWARGGFDAIFHLAAVVSGQAETDFELGYAVNLDGTRHLLEAARHVCDRPIFVFASSCAVYGGDLPDPVTDTTHLTPQSSYGNQKAMGERLVADYHRKGFVIGTSLRLPTIVVRPGRPNLATTTFLSSIVREPLNGETANCPVPLETKMYCLSPRCVVEAFIRAAELPEEALGKDRSLLLPGIAFTVAEEIAALERIAGKNVTARITYEPDALVRWVVLSIPWNFAPERALRLGFPVDADVESIIRQHIEDERGGSFVP
ncbi:MAG: SDR family oxidoreductase [Geminicoccaceae bacterium]|nr:SDR family oxidoreductase [Geminicoccaceae bacterium]MDW8124159.1 SDR family oxidoreductase [Geminicoccaceae bacterium]